jgi:hypothetical protein
MLWPLLVVGLVLWLRFLILRDGERRNDAIVEAHLAACRSSTNVQREMYMGELAQRQALVK